MSDWLLKFEKDDYYIGFTNDSVRIGLKGVGAIDYKKGHPQYNIVHRLSPNHIAAHFDKIWNNIKGEQRIWKL